MRCPDCHNRNSVAARVCHTCGHKFARKPLPKELKLGTAVFAGLVVMSMAVASVIPRLTDPQQNLERVSRDLAAGPKNADDARRKREEFDRAMRGYLSKAGNLSDPELVKKLQKVLPNASFEVHVSDLPRGLRIVEVDTVLQAADYLVMKNGANTKVFTLPGLEVFDDARLINESAGPMLVLLGHTGGQGAHRPQIKIYALLPDDISDETEKLLDPIKGDGTARFAKNGRDLVLDLSLLSVGQSSGLFAAGPQGDDGNLRQYLEWKNAHYTSRYEYGTSPFTVLYAVARCMKYPDLISSHNQFLGSRGQQLVGEFKSADAGNFKVQKVATKPDSITYAMSGNVGDFHLTVSRAGAGWSVASAGAGMPKELKEASATANGATSAPSVTAAAQTASQALPPPSPMPPAQQPELHQPAPIVERQVGQAPAMPAPSLPAPAPAPSPGSKQGFTSLKQAMSQAKQTFAEAKQAVSDAKHDSRDRHKKDKHGRDIDTDTATTTRELPPPSPSPAESSSNKSPQSASIGKGEIMRSISANTVKLRRSPNTDGKTLTELSKGAPVEILGKENGWYRVRADGKEGYIYGGLVDYKKSDAYTTAVITKNARVVTDSRHHAVNNPQVGDRIVILGGIHNNKYKVQLANGKTGYVDKDALDVSVEAPPLVP